MSAAPNQISEFGQWSATPDGAEIRYSLAALRSIKSRAQEAFLSVPKGGIEIGGILFGRISPRSVTVLAERELTIDYVSGPSFVLSPADEDRLRELLAKAADDPDLAGLEAVGWYASHTRSDLSLNRHDLELYSRFFPAPGQVALLLKPFKFEPAQLSLFFRDPDGTLQDGPPFTLEDPVAKRPAPVAIRPAEPKAELVHTPSEAIIHYESPPPAPPLSERRKFLLPAIAAILLLCAALMWLRPKSAAEFEPVALRVTPSGEQVSIEWEGGSDRVRRATSAEMWITDGGKTTRRELNPDQLRSGRIIYPPEAGPLEVRMRFHGGGTEGAEQFAYFAHQRPAAAPSPAVASDPEEIAKMKAEVDRLNAQLKQLQQPAQTDALPRREAPLVRPPSSEQQQPAAVSSQPRQSAPLVARSSAPPAAQVIEPAAQPLSGTRFREAPAVQLPSIGELPPPPRQAQPVESAPTRAAAPPARTPVAPARRSGRAIWTGELRSGDVLVIDGRRPSAGTLTGEWFNGAARVRVYPGELAAGGLVVYSPEDRHRGMDNVESPSEKNGWNVTSYKWDRKRSQSVSVLQSPSAAANRLMLRNAGKTVPVLFIEWETVPEQAQ